jgi:hypothetical protein
MRLDDWLQRCLRMPRYRPEGPRKDSPMDFILAPSQSNFRSAPFIATIPIGSFRRPDDNSYAFEGIIDGVRLDAKIELMGGFR